MRTQNKQNNKNLLNLLLIGAMTTSTLISTQLVPTSYFQKSVSETQETESRYTRRKMFCNNDSIPDYHLMKDGYIEETWYGLKNSKGNISYMTEKETQAYKNWGKKWNLE